MSRILIVDGHAYAYRAFYAIRSMTGPDGRATNAIFGFIKMLVKMRAKVDPTHWVVVWDGGLSAERQEALPEYKAQRPDMPDELGRQLDEIQRYLAAAGVSSYCRDGVEADDYIAFLAQAAGDAGWEVVIASADKDFLQLVGPRVGLLNPNDKSEKIWSAAEVEAKTGVQPGQIVDWLSLVGDTVDNIPGVAGVGPKTAANLLKQFGSIDGLYGRLDEVASERVRVALGEARARVRRNQSLVRLRPEVGEDFQPDRYEVRPGDGKELAGLFRTWGFRSMLAEVEAAAKQQPELLI